MTNMNPKLIAVVSYLLMPGWFFALIINSNQRTELGTFHVRQSFGLMCLGTIIAIVVGLVNYFPLTVIGILPILVLWIMGIISAIQGKLQLLPFVGKAFQKWFSGI